MTIRLLLTLLPLLAASPALAEHEGPEAHARGTTKTIVFDSADIRPEEVKLGRGEVLSFINHSTHPMQVTFIEPADLAKRVRCGLVRDAKAKGDPAAPWALFAFGDDGKLAARVPPGQFASVCSFEPGHYTFTAETIGHQTQSAGASGVLPRKGQIDVE
jgi:hypothetical protein